MLHYNELHLGLPQVLLLLSIWEIHSSLEILVKIDLKYDLPATYVYKLF